MECFAFNALDCENSLLQARACWVYGKYAKFDFQDESHLILVTQKIVNLLHHEHIVVKVEAAIALSELLSHEKAVDLIRPNLGNMLRKFLKIMDEIDVEQLITSLRNIVDAYGDELAPYAVSLC